MSLYYSQLLSRLEEECNDTKNPPKQQQQSSQSLRSLLCTRPSIGPCTGERMSSAIDDALREFPPLLLPALLFAERLPLQNEVRNLPFGPALHICIYSTLQDSIN